MATKKTGNNAKKAPTRTALKRATPYQASASSADFSKRLFDARPDRLDLRDLPYRPPLRSLLAQFPGDKGIARLLPGYVKAGLVLDQGAEGACTGFGLACVANYLLWERHTRDVGKRRFEPVSPRMLYELARRYDEWPGEKYDGSSCRGAIKGWHKHGVCSGKLWPYPFDADGKPVFRQPGEGWAQDAASRTLGVYYRVNRESVVDIQAAIAEIGAVYVSAQVHDGWDQLAHGRATAAPKRHREIPVIPPKRPHTKLGGHSFALIGYDERGFIVQNSWGKVWGAGGFAILPYADWIAHASDAWACALGVPTLPSDARLQSARWPVRSGNALGVVDRASSTPGNPADDPWPIDRSFDCKQYQPWPTHQAYQHTLVTDNDGMLLVRDFTRGSDTGTAAYAAEILHDEPAAFLRASKDSVVKLALYAHGGLNGEDASIQRIRMLGPYFQANGVYPLFLTWKTGPGETLADIVQDWSRKLFGDTDGALASGFIDTLGEMRDRAIEATGRLFGRGVWSEMRENAALGTSPGHGLDWVARELTRLRQTLAKSGKKLELHLIGHSAGSILLGHLLARLRESAEPPQVASCALYAAACSVKFACENYLPTAAEQASGKVLLPLDQLYLFHLDDDNEKADALPTPALQIYGKSLLYLVSRALDDERKQPLLGMQRALLSKYINSEYWAESQLSYIRAWQKQWSNQLGHAVTTPRVITSKRKDSIQATHGSFDNNLEILTATLERIRGSKLIAPMEWLDY